MLVAIGITTVVAITATVCWMSTWRPVDRVSFLLGTAAKFGFRRFILRRPILHQLKLSNGLTLPMPRQFLKHSIDEILKLRMRPDDVIVASYAKSGTTWMQEIVWLICNDADTETATAIGQYARYGYVEAVENQGLGNGLQSIERWPMEKRRFIKTHLPFDLLPNELQNKSTAKMIYVARNPKDCCVSLYHFHRMAVSSLPEPGTWSDFLRKFCNGDVIYGSWFDHVSKFWQVYQQRKDTIYYTSYEALKYDLKGEVMKLAKFLEKDLTEENIEAIVQHCTFSSMSASKKAYHGEAHESGAMNFKVSKFMRKGEVGDWKNYFTINENEAFDQLFKEKTKDWNVKFEFETR